MPILDFKSRDVRKIVKSYSNKYGAGIGVIIADVLSGRVAIVENDINIDKLGEAVFELTQDSEVIALSGVGTAELTVVFAAALPELALFGVSSVLSQEAVEIARDPFANPFAQEESSEEQRLRDQERQRRNNRNNRFNRDAIFNIDSNQPVPTGPTGVSEFANPPRTDTTFTPTPRRRRPTTRQTSRPPASEGFEDVPLFDPDPDTQMKQPRTTNTSIRDGFISALIGGAVASGIGSIGSSRQFYQVKLIRIKELPDDIRQAPVVNDYVGIFRDLTAYLYYVIRLDQANSFKKTTAVKEIEFRFGILGYYNFIAKALATYPGVPGEFVPSGFWPVIREQLFTILPNISEVEMVRTSVELFNIFADEFNNTPRPDDLELKLMNFLNKIRENIITKIKVFKTDIMLPDVTPTKITRQDQDSLGVNVDAIGLVDDMEPTIILNDRTEQHVVFGKSTEFLQDTVLQESGPNVTEQRRAAKRQKVDLGIPEDIKPIEPKNNQMEIAVVLGGVAVVGVGLLIKSRI